MMASELLCEPYTDWSSAIVGGLLLAYFVIAEISTARGNRRRRERFARREIVSLSQWEQEWARAKGGVLADSEKETIHLICRALAERLRCDFRQIRPTDRFDDELASGGISFFGLDGEDLDDVLEAALYEHSQRSDREGLRLEALWPRLDLHATVFGRPEIESPGVPEKQSGRQKSS